MINRVRVQVAEHELQLDLTDEAKDLLVEKGWDPSMGARPLRRAIQRYIEDPLADEVLRQGQMTPGSTVLVERDASGDEEDKPLSLRIVAPTKPPKAEAREARAREGRGRRQTGRRRGRDGRGHALARGDRAEHRARRRLLGQLPPPLAAAGFLDVPAGAAVADVLFPGAAEQPVLARFAEQGVPAGPAVDRVLAGAAADDVVAGQAPDPVGAAEAGDHVGLGGALELVGGAGADDRRRPAVAAFPGRDRADRDHFGPGEAAGEKFSPFAGRGFDRPGDDRPPVGLHGQAFGYVSRGADGGDGLAPGPEARVELAAGGEPEQPGVAGSPESGDQDLAVGKDRERLAFVVAAGGVEGEDAAGCRSSGRGLRPR